MQYTLILRESVLPLVGVPRLPRARLSELIRAITEYPCVPRYLVDILSMIPNLSPAIPMLEVVPSARVAADSVPHLRHGANQAFYDRGHGEWLL
jgi:hypothetical protein